MLADGTLVTVVRYHYTGRFYSCTFTPELLRELRAYIALPPVGVVVHPDVEWFWGPQRALQQARSYRDVCVISDRLRDAYLREGVYTFCMVSNLDNLVAVRPKHRRGKRHKMRPTPLYDVGEEGRNEAAS